MIESSIEVGELQIGRLLGKNLLFCLPNVALLVGRELFRRRNQILP